MGITEDTFQDFVFSVKDGEASLVKYTGKEQTVWVPAKYGEFPVTTINCGAFISKVLKKSFSLTA